MAWSSPSPLAGEGGSPRSGETGEGLSPRAQLSFAFAERNPSSGASRHLLPPGEKGKSASALSFRHAPDLRAERIQPFVDALVAALDLVGVVDRGGALGADGRQQHGHAGANVG